MIAAALGMRHHTNKGILAHKEFSVSIPSCAMLKQVDYVGLVSGGKIDKSRVFETVAGELEHAPIVKGCAVAMQCRLFRSIELGFDELFIGEVAAAYAEPSCLSDGRPDLKKIDPFLLTMPDNRYWRVGEFLAPAWSVGKDFPISER